MEKTIEIREENKMENATANNKTKVTSTTSVQPKIDYEKKSIVITKDFAKKASVIDSPEFKQLIKLKNNFRDYSIEVRSSSKRSAGAGKITLAKMEAYISKHDVDGKRMETFNKMRYEEKGENLERTSFFAIKKWFFEQYPDLRKVS